MTVRPSKIHRSLGESELLILPHIGAAFAGPILAALGIILSLEGILGFWDSTLREPEANFQLS
jgi:hypothetical protein